MSSIKSSVTLFSTPKAFAGRNADLQRNAITSWTLLDPQPEIILLGDDEGAAEIAQELNLRHIPDIKRSAHGTPLVNDMFACAETNASGDLLVYINADMVLMDDFLSALDKVSDRFEQFLMIQQRWDLDFEGLIDFTDAAWRDVIRNLVWNTASLHSVSGIDYFAFRRGLWKDIPPFAVGRTAWDNWLVNHPIINGYPVVDATQDVMLVHLNHDWSHIKGGWEEAWKGEEAQHNRVLAGEDIQRSYTFHAGWRLSRGCLEQREPYAPLNQPLGEPSPNVMALFSRGIEQLQAGNIQSALTRLDAANRQHPWLPQVQYARALALAQLKRFDEARVAAWESLCVQTDNPDARKLVYQLEMQQNEPDPDESNPVPLAGNEEPTISILIPTYNRAEYIGEAVKSALEQSSPADEIIVIDDGSVDQTEEIVRRLDVDGIRYVRKEHSGAPGTRNRGVREARGDYIVWLDSDDVLMPKTVELYRNAIKETPEADVIYGNLMVTDEDLRLRDVIRYEDWYGRNHELIGRIIHEDPVPNGSTLIKRNCFERYGYYDESYKRAHDYHFWTRLARDAVFRHIDALVLKWRWHESNMSSGSVRIDTSYDIRLITDIVERYSLVELFPQLSWTGDDESLSTAIALIQVALNLIKHNGLVEAREYLVKSRTAQPTPEASELLDKIDSVLGKPMKSHDMQIRQVSEQRLRILFVVHGFLPDSAAGTELHTLWIARELKKRGHQVKVLYPAIDANKPANQINEGKYQDIDIARINIHVDGDLVHEFWNEQEGESIAEYATRFNANLVHFQHLLRISASAVEACHKRGLPTVMTSHDGWFLCEQFHFVNSKGDFCTGPETVDKCVRCFTERHSDIDFTDKIPDLFYYLAMRREYLRKTMDSIDCMIIPSEYLANCFSDYGMKPRRVEVISHGIPLLDQIPHQAGNGRIRFAYFGNIFYTKGLDILIKAFNLLDPDKAELNLYGMIADEAYYNKAMEERGAQHRVSYHGAYDHSDLPKILSCNDVAVIPSRAESFALVIQEAFSQRIPVIGPALGGVPERIEDGVNGWLFKPGDIDNLSDKLRFFLQNPDSVFSFRDNIPPVKSIADYVNDLEEVYRATC